MPKCEYTKYNKKRGYHKCGKKATHRMTEGQGSNLCGTHKKKMSPFKLKFKKI